MYRIRRRGRQVRSLEIEIGELSSVVPEAIEFCFEACSRVTVVAGEELRVREIEVDD